MTLTFGDLDARSNRLARVLAGYGLVEGDRLAVFLPNSVAFIDVFLACVKLGAILVPINVLYRQREVAHIVGDAVPRFVVTTEDAAGVFPAGTPILDVNALSHAAEQQSAEAVRIALDGGDPAALVYTSGTTGRSKGAILSHDNFMANAANLIASWRITSADRYLAVLPLFHVHGLANGIVCWLATGCRMRLVAKFDVAGAAALFATFRPTLFFGVPTVFVRLLELPLDISRAIGGDVRLFVSGSAPLPAPVFAAFRDQFGHAILE